LLFCSDLISSDQDCEKRGKDISALESGAIRRTVSDAEKDWQIGWPFVFFGFEISWTAAESPTNHRPSPWSLAKANFVGTNRDIRIFTGTGAGECHAKVIPMTVSIHPSDLEQEDQHSSQSFS
jgi:hypothetical protein